MKKAISGRWIHISGIFSFFLFLILALSCRHLLGAIMKSQLELNPYSILYKMWIKNDIPIYLKLYIFNCTNAHEFKKDKTVVPNFAEVGPFLYEESREKVNISWNDFEETVTFNQSKIWRFLPELSEDLSLNITNLNPIASTISHISRLWESPLQKQIANTLINKHEPLFVTASSQQWFFDGIPDEFLELFEILRKVTEIPIPYNKFGWFYDRNGSTAFDGVFTIKTGKSSMDNLGMMTAWNHKNKTEHYVDDCALVFGSTGEIIPPLKQFQKTLSVFAPDICSYVTLKYKNDVDVEGINAFEFVGDESVFDNGTSHPENSCFYVGEPCPSGSRNVTSCRFGSPAFISFPHFYLADSYYTEKLTGMNPDESKHKFSLKIEPNTGIPLAVEAAFQINFLVESYPWCDEFRGLPKMYIPMFWFKQTAKISKGYANALKTLLFLQRNGGYIIFACSFLILFSVLLVIYLKNTL